MACAQPLDPSALRSIRQANRLPLTRNVREITIQSSADSLAQMLELYSGPTVTRLSLAYNEDYTLVPETSIFLRNIATSWPTLEALSLDGHSFDGRASKEIFTSWPALRWLHCGVVTPEAVLEISAIPTLVHFGFECPEDTTEEQFVPSLAALAAIPDPNMPRRFRYLSTLEVTLHRITHLTQILNLANMEQLQWLDIHVITDTSCGSAVDWAAIFTALHQRCAYESLERIRVDFSIGDEHEEALAEDERTILRFSALIPLFSFHNLVEFRCDLVDGFDLDDSDLRTMARAWPRLRELALAAAYGWTVPSHITISGLAALLEHCPNLEILEIVVDLTSNHSRVSIPAQNTLLEYIDLGNSPVGGNPLAIATSLRYMMPNLVHINAWGMDVHSYLSAEESAQFRTRWKNINTLLPVVPHIWSRVIDYRMGGDNV
ncbi:hypothetical protein PLICRDRAFT_170673 [Plicaturopsis crispa FD-325 SS-3]|nr:hypothetical protein PLICRDRAFT_170673 [Plicaturopsis crispa FD-325 SS-3]